MEKEEFSKLARAMRADIMALSRRFLGDETEAEDNVQDTLLRLWSVRHRLEEVRSVSALTFAICRNLCISKLRRHKTVPLSLSDEIRIASDHDTAWQLEDEENARWLEGRIGELPFAQMQILRMSQQDGLENSEIAELLGITETTVRTALSKARKRLLKQFIMHNS